MEVNETHANWVWKGSHLFPTLLQKDWKKMNATKKKQTYENPDFENWWLQLQGPAGVWSHFQPAGYTNNIKWYIKVIKQTFGIIKTPTISKIHINTYTSQPILLLCNKTRLPCTISCVWRKIKLHGQFYMTQSCYFIKSSFGIVFVRFQLHEY